MAPEEFNEWLESGGIGDMTPAEYGEVLYTQQGCNACHSVDGCPESRADVAGSLWEREPTRWPIGSAVTVDENYPP